MFRVISTPLSYYESDIIQSVTLHIWLRLESIFCFGSPEPTLLMISFRVHLMSIVCASCLFKIYFDNFCLIIKPGTSSQKCLLHKALPFHHSYSQKLQILEPNVQHLALFIRPTIIVQIDLLGQRMFNQKSIRLCIQNVTNTC